jgi:hypothetical protein
MRALTVLLLLAALLLGTILFCGCEATGGLGLTTQKQQQDGGSNKADGGGTVNAPQTQTTMVNNPWLIGLLVLYPAFQTWLSAVWHENVTRPRRRQRECQVLKP